jgi:RNA polymerase sigma-70 factor, ECF subfamily
VKDNDTELIRQCLSGKPDAYGVLLQKYHDRLFRSVLSLTLSYDDAMDVVQDAFINAYQSLSQFKGDSEFYTWLYRIAFNSAMSMRRKRRVMLSLNSSPDYFSELPTRDSHDCDMPSAGLDRAESQTLVRLAIAKLSAEHREVLMLKDMDGLKYEQIAEILDLPIGTVRSRLHRARFELKSILQELDAI